MAHTCYRMLPTRVYPAFVTIVQQISLNSTPEARIYIPHRSVRKRVIATNHARELQMLTQRGLIKIVHNADTERNEDGWTLTEFGSALARAMAGKAQEGGFDVFSFFTGLPEKVMIDFLLLPGYPTGVWGRVFHDLKLVDIRPRTQMYDIALETETVLEWIASTPNPPHPYALRDPPAMRAPDRARLAQFREVARSVWGMKLPPRPDDDDPDFSYPYEDEWDIL